MNRRWFLLALLFILVVIASTVQLSYVSTQNNKSKLTEENRIREQEQEIQRMKRENAVLESRLKMMENNATGDTNQTAQAFNATSGEAKLLEMINAPSNVITNKDTLVYLLHNFNEFGAVRNEDKFTLEKDYVPIVIRVYDKHEYFKFALDHYREVQDINKTMMIVSHDGVFPEMFKLVQSIDFCQVKQVIHPYTGHMLKNRFPGPDSTIPDAGDQYGNPRPFPQTSLKHHFWWHLNFVWDQFLPSHDGDMVFMEEDHIPTIDFYRSIKALATIRDKECPDTCFNAKIFGNSGGGGGDHDLYLTHNLGNLGMTFKRNMWEKLRARGEEFCKFDDYNWDWTMTHLTSHNLIPVLSLTAAFPRAEHLGKCGTHAKEGSCSINEEDVKHFEQVNAKLKENGGDWSKYNLNPTPIDSPSQHHTGWGGWAHKMDHEHCLAQIKKV